MKKIDLFGRRVTIDFEKKEKIKKEDKDIERTTKEVINEKIIYMILIAVIVVLSSNTYLLKSNLKLGDVATKDIVAPIDVVYNDKGAKEEILTKIWETSPKEYIAVENVEEETLKKINLFFEIINSSEELTEDETLERVRDKLGVNIGLNIFSYFYGKTTKELALLQEKYIKDVYSLYEYGVKKEGAIFKLELQLERLPDMTLEEKEFLMLFVKPNYILDTVKTEELLRDKASQIKDIVVKINAGSVILKKGETVSESKIEILKSVGLYGSSRKILRFTGISLYLLLVSVIFRNICLKFILEELGKKNYYRAIILSMTFGILALRIISPSWRYVLPIETVFILLGILINLRVSLIIGSFLILFGLPLIGFNLEYTIIEIFSLLLSIYLVKRIKNRTDIINTGVYVGAIKVVILLIMAIITHMDFVESILKSGTLLLSGVFTGMLTIALLPYFERTFNILTDIKLLELGDLSQPLLRALSVAAPGTFHHSMMVATLSERATEAIGGNHIFARVASYYHDIGKMKRPQFYVENQADGINLHNNLSPTLSTLIITSHTKDGDDMGREHNLPKEIRDIMYEHQGTTLLAYFYNKAKQGNPNLKETDFRYSGPKPRSKESAVIMLADSIEAAARSLDEKSPVTIEKMLRKIINSKIEEQQLSDADLTFKEIEIIIKTFTKVLMSIHHVRIKYPGQK